MHERTYDEHDLGYKLARIEEQIKSHAINAANEARRAEEARRQDEARRAEDVERAEAHRNELRKTVDKMVDKVEKMDDRLGTVEKVMYGVNLSTRMVFTIFASVIGILGAAVATWKALLAGFFPHP